MFVNLTAVGNPAPVCTHNNIDINCLGELVELTRNYFNLSLSARNTAGLERSCRRSAKFGKTNYFSKFTWCFHKQKVLYVL
jgi:hypothetical protein